MKKTIGRPSKHTESTTLEITRYLSDGVPFKYACNLAGIGESTGYDWLHKHETFRSQVAVARSQAIHKLIKHDSKTPEARSNKDATPQGTC